MQPVGFDIESANADQLFLYGPGFVRLSGYTDNDDIKLTTDPEELIQRLYDAPWNYTHGGFLFDLLALAYWHGMDWERVAGKSLDTMLLDRLNHPPQARTARGAGSIDKYDLNTVCERRGVHGKTDEIKRLAQKYGGYDQIPVDDEEYREYLRGDVQAISELIDTLPRTAYGKREHRVAMINGRMTLNGFLVDIPLLNQRIAEGEEHKQEALHALADDYGLPLGRFGWKGRGKDKEEIWETFSSPLATLEGKKWLLEMWDAFGIVNPPITKKGNLSTSAEELRELIETEVLHPDLENILELMMIVTQTRTVYQTVADHLTPQNRVHPLINMGQASGRNSVTSPGLTVFGKRNGRYVEREVFIAEPGYVVMTCDLRQVDMRAVAGLSQDPNYIDLFIGTEEDGSPKDPHAATAEALFGDRSKRSEVKPINHGYNYGLGQNKMIANGFNPQVVKTFFQNMQTSFPILMEWREEIRAQARAGKLLDNGFGRKMKANPARAYTQGPALMGQGAAADILKEAQLRIPRELWPYLRVPVHDEIVMACPARDAAEIGRELVKAMTFEWCPPGASIPVPIECELSEAGPNWGATCGH